MRSTIGLALGMLVTAAGCNCGSKAHTAVSSLLVSPSTVDFGNACVKPADPSLTVQPEARTVQLENTGVSELGIASLFIDGGTAFTIDGGFPSQLSAGQSVSVEVDFLPTAAGPFSAALVATDDLGRVQIASLTGMGASTTPEPVVLLDCPGGFGADGGGPDRCYDVATMQTAANPLMWFPNTAAGDTANLTLVVTNTGCATLQVTSVAIDGGGFVLGQNSVPFSLEGGSGSANHPTQSIPVQFEPTSATAYQGTLTLQTNVPGTPAVNVQLLGVGVQPNLELCTTIGGTPTCSTSAVALTCDFSASPACSGDFVASNAGLAPLQIDNVSLAYGDLQFKITSAPSPLPYTLAPNGSAGDSVPITVSYTPRSAFDSDQLVVHSTSGVMRADVHGGQPPQLVIIPAPGDSTDDVDFNKNAAGTTISLPNGFTGIKVFQISNAGTGSLVVQNVFFPDTTTTTWPQGAPYPYLSLTAPDAGTVIPPSGSANVSVQYTDPPNGGPSGSAALATTIEIDSNDPLWPLVSGGKRVTVEAKTPCNPNPVAVVQGPTTAAQGMTVTMDGTQSYDTDPDSTGSCQPGLQCPSVSPPAGCPANPIAHWQWALQSGPTDAGASLTPMGMTSSPTSQLFVGNCSPCSFVVRLVVYDDTPPTAANPNGLPSTYQDYTVSVP